MKLNKDFCYTIGIIVAIALALCAFLRPNKEGFLQKFGVNSNTPPWKIDVNRNTKSLNFIYQGNLMGDGKKVKALELTKDGNLNIHRGISFEQPIRGSWQIAPNKNNTLIIANKAGGGIKFDSAGSILPIKYGGGGPLDYSKLCIKKDATGIVFSEGCNELKK